MSILAIDYGEKRIGLAIGEIGGLAQTLKVLSNSEKVVNKLGEICKEENIKKILIGLPLDSKGKIGFAAKGVQAFTGKLSREVQLPIEFVDESLTSREALSHTIRAGKKRKDRKNLDSISAAIILQEYLDNYTLKD